MAKKPTEQQPLTELKFNLLGKLLVGAIGMWLVGKKTNTKIRGTPEEIKAISDAMIASKAFQDELSKPGATVDSVVEKLNLKHLSAAQVKHKLGIDWPL